MISVLPARNDDNFLLKGVSLRGNDIFGGLGKITQNVLRMT